MHFDHARECTIDACDWEINRAKMDFKCTGAKCKNMKIASTH